MLHMLGVVQLSRMRYREALDLLWDAAERTQWAVPPIRHNLGLVLAKLLAPSANRRLAELMAEFLAWERSHSLVREDTSPLVTVVLPAYNNARHIVQAITSVTGQTYPNIELVVIDDGSTDDTAKIVAECITRVSQPVRFHSRDNRGAPATLNEGAALAQGRYLAFLNARDHYASDRIACLVEQIARRGLRWGFSLVSGIDEGPKDHRTEAANVAESYQHAQRARLFRSSNSFALFEYNIAVSTGNLFVERDFFFSVGGFTIFPLTMTGISPCGQRRWLNQRSCSAPCTPIISTTTRTAIRISGRRWMPTRCVVISSRRSWRRVRPAPTRSHHKRAPITRC